MKRGNFAKTSLFIGRHFKGKVEWDELGLEREA
jgi:hypothetical protein